MIASSNEANVDAAVERPIGMTGSTAELRNEASLSRFFEKLGAFDHLAIGEAIGTAQCLRPREILISLRHATAQIVRTALRK
jgi:hypothetical protein